MQRRRSLLLLSQISLSVALLTGCGFKLRGSQNFAFTRIAVLPQPGGPMAIELRRTLARSMQVLMSEDDLSQAQVVLDILQEQREKVVVGVNSAGQVREFQLRSRLKFRLRTPSGQELVPAAEIVQKRDISFNESAALAKGAEEDLLYRDMQTDIVQQLLRRLATVDHAARP
jgi:LPS-assembly lipoprotein